MNLERQILNMQVVDRFKSNVKTNII